MLTTSKQMLLDAQQHGYAIPAFNIENMEMAQAVVQAARDARSPIMIQTTPSTVRYAGCGIFYAMVYALTWDQDTRVALHLDHGESFDMAANAVREGYTSIMIDGSKLPFDQNVQLTQKTVAIAKPNGLPVEAELGAIGGKEDDLTGEGGSYTDPEQAREFIAKTQASSLAVAIGTAHGIYSTTPVLDVQRLSAIRKIVDVPLVLHGGSGLSDQQVRDCISRGICKVNFATELRIAYSDGVKLALKQNPDAYDPKVYGKSGREYVYKLALSKIELCGSQNRIDT